jgi:hypothetical protein
MGNFLVWLFAGSVIFFIGAFFLLLFRSRRLCDEMIERAKAEYDARESGPEK